MDNTIDQGCMDQGICGSSAKYKITRISIRNCYHLIIFFVHDRNIFFCYTTKSYIRHSTEKSEVRLQSLPETQREYDLKGFTSLE